MVRAGHLQRWVSDLADSELVFQNQMLWAWVRRLGDTAGACMQRVEKPVAEEGRYSFWQGWR